MSKILLAWLDRIDLCLTAFMFKDLKTLCTSADFFLYKTKWFILFVTGHCVDGSGFGETFSTKSGTNATRGNFV